MIVQDWFHSPVFGVWFTERQTPPVSADTGLINGKNKNGTLGEYSEFLFTPGTKYRMRLINTSTDQHFKFSIDQHTMTVQAADFVPVQPYSQTVLEIALGTWPPPLLTDKGQRYDIIVEADQPPGDYWMRAVSATSCSDNLNPNGTRAIVRYQNDCSVDVGCSAEPDSIPYSISSMECKDEIGLVPVVPRDVGSLTSGDEITINSIQTNYFKFIINGSSLFIDWNSPTLLMVDNLNESFPDSYNIISLNGTSDTV